LFSSDHPEILKDINCFYLTFRREMYEMSSRGCLVSLISSFLELSFGFTY
jgi:hypothetical protein